MTVKEYKTVSDREALLSVVTDTPHSIIDRMVLADWYEEHGMDGDAEMHREVIRRMKDQLGTVLIEKLDAARKRGMSGNKIDMWLGVWEEHHGIDPSWDEIWMREIE